MKNFGVLVAAKPELILGDSNDGIVNLYYVQVNLKPKTIRVNSICCSQNYKKRSSRLT